MFIASVCPSVCLSVRPSVRPSVCLSETKIWSFENKIWRWFRRWGVREGCVRLPHESWISVDFWFPWMAFLGGVRLRQKFPWMIKIHEYSLFAWIFSRSCFFVDFFIATRYAILHITHIRWGKSLLDGGAQRNAHPGDYTAYKILPILRLWNWDKG